eukprot:scaffold43337_cov69-Phaeocystis_antarctica.AAC.10
MNSPWLCHRPACEEPTSPRVPTKGSVGHVQPRSQPQQRQPRSEPQQRQPRSQRRSQPQGFQECGLEGFLGLEWKPCGVEGLLGLLLSRRASGFLGLLEALRLGDSWESLLAPTKGRQGALCRVTQAQPRAIQAQPRA